jgi:dihydroorotase
MSEVVLLRGGVVVDAGGERPADVVVVDGVVEAVAADAGAGRSGTVLDCEGAYVLPGFVDLFTGVGEPVEPSAETIETASRAAVLAGCTAIVTAVAAADPLDSAAHLHHLRALAQGAVCSVVPSAALTMGGAGERLVPIAELTRLGIRLFGDPHGVEDPTVLRRAMAYAADLGVTVALDPTDPGLAAGGHMHEGAWSSLLGIAGVPAEAEELGVGRALALALRTGVRLHLRHLSTAASVGMVAAARRAGLALTADVAVANAVFVDGDCADFDPAYKLHPPLRPETDRAAIADAVRAGAVDALASGHAPALLVRKEVPFAEAAPGGAMLPYATALAFDTIGCPPTTAVQVLADGPARIAGIAATHGGPVAAGRPANLTVFDPGATWTIGATYHPSLTNSTPFAGRTLRGRARHTLVDGIAVVIDAEAQR